MTNSPAPPAPVAGRYRPIAPLGNGGMGTVWEAVDDRLHRPVALKLAVSGDTDLTRRTRAEARSLAAVHHPNVVVVLDAGEHDGRAFVVTELVRGPSLRTLLATGPVAPDRVARLGHQLASALACAHEHGVVHRDLTPANVLVDDESGEAKLIDFGIAMSEHAAGLTATGLVVGTPAYLAPEQVEGRRATATSDVYSLGLVLIEALTGRRPFPGGPTATTAARLVADAPVPDELPAGWSRVLGPMTRRDPDRRPSAAAVAAGLAALVPTGTGAPLTTPTLLDGPRVGATAAPTSSTPMATAARTATLAPHRAPVDGATTARRPGGTRRSGGRAWPLVLAGTALALALVLIAGFGALQGGGADAPDAVATDTTDATTSTTGAVTVADAPTTPIAAVAPTTTAAETSTSTAASPGPAAKGRGAAPGKAGEGRGKGKG